MAVETCEFRALKRREVPLETLLFDDNCIDAGDPADPEATRRVTRATITLRMSSWAIRCKAAFSLTPRPMSSQQAAFEADAATRTTSTMKTWSGSFRGRTPPPSPTCRAQRRSRLSAESTPTGASSASCSAEHAFQSDMFIETVCLHPPQLSHDAKHHRFTHRAGSCQRDAA